jgi:hypothetical protein
VIDVMRFGLLEPCGRSAGTSVVRRRADRCACSGEHAVDGSLGCCEVAARRPSEGRRHPRAGSVVGAVDEDRDALASADPTVADSVAPRESSVEWDVTGIGLTQHLEQDRRTCRSVPLPSADDRTRIPSACLSAMASLPVRVHRLPAPPGTFPRRPCREKTYIWNVSAVAQSYTLTSTAGRYPRLRSAGWGSPRPTSPPLPSPTREDPGHLGLATGPPAAESAAFLEAQAIGRVAAMAEQEECRADDAIAEQGMNVEPGVCADVAGLGACGLRPGRVLHDDRRLTDRGT